MSLLLLWFPVTVIEAHWVAMESMWCSTAFKMRFSKIMVTSIYKLLLDDLGSTWGLFGQMGCIHLPSHDNFDAAWDWPKAGGKHGERKASCWQVVSLVSGEGLFTSLYTHKISVVGNCSCHLWIQVLFLCLHPKQVGISRVQQIRPWDVRIVCWS